MRPYDRRAPLVSLHVPKTAGTSLRLALGQWFPGRRLLPHYRNLATGAPPVRHRFKGPICVHGHFNGSNGMGVDAYYPQAAQFIAFLRDPFERFVSIFSHFSEVARRGAVPDVTRNMGADPSFERFLKDFAAEHAAGGGGLAYKWFLPGAPDVSLIKGRLANDFVFVGITERYPASLVALTKCLGMPAVRETFENRIERPAVDFGRWRSLHETSFPDDYELYATALDLNAKQLADGR